MRYRAVILVLLLSVAALAPAKEESLEQLKQRAEAAKLSDQPKLFLELAEFQLKAADTAYQAGNVDQGQLAVEDVAGYSEKAGSAAITSRKHMKNVEIKVRDMEHKLADIRRNVEFDDRPPLEAAINRMEKVRAALLKAMFGPKS